MQEISNGLPCQILYGSGAVGHLPDRLPRGRVIVMSEEKLARTALFGRIRESFPEAEFYLQQGGEPRISDVQKAVDTLRDREPAVIVGVGGGSVLDVAKATALLLDKREPVAEAMGNRDIRRSIALALIPTTAGTGSEATRNCLFIDDRDGIKRALIAQDCIPDVAVLDPEMTRTLPAPVAAFTGIDALCHCVESYISVRANEVSRAWSLAGMRLILTWLPRAVASPEDEEAREKMLFASFFGGAALAIAGTTAVHALAYSLGKRGVPHGVSNSLLFETVMRHTLGQPERVIEHYDEGVRLIRSLPIPSIDGYNVRAEECGAMAREAMEQTRLLGNHPVPVSEACAAEIFQSLF